MSRQKAAMVRHAWAVELEQKLMQPSTTPLSEDDGAWILGMLTEATRMAAIRF